MSLLGKIKKAVKKVAKVVTTINPALGGGFTDINKMQGQLLTAGMGALGAPVSLPGGANPLASLLGSLGSKVGLPANLGTALASNLLPIPGGSVVDDLRAYGAYKLAPDSLLQSLSFDAAGNPLKKRRRMNPLNARAAKRAIRRIKAVRKITAGIERALPKAKARGHAHFGHHHHRR